MDCKTFKEAWGNGSYLDDEDLFYDVIEHMENCEGCKIYTEEQYILDRMIDVALSKAKPMQLTDSVYHALVKAANGYVIKGDFDSAVDSLSVAVEVPGVDLEAVNNLVVKIDADSLPHESKEKYNQIIAAIQKGNVESTESTESIWDHIEIDQSGFKKALIRSSTDSREESFIQI